MSNKKGRPRKKEKLYEVHIHLRLRQGEDDDLISYFQNIPIGERVLAVKYALRSGKKLEQSADVLDSSDLDELEDALFDMLF
jgi:hypothetical protein